MNSFIDNYSIMLGFDKDSLLVSLHLPKEQACVENIISYDHTRIDELLSLVNTVTSNNEEDAEFGTSAIICKIKNDDTDFYWNRDTFEPLEDYKPIYTIPTKMFYQLAIKHKEYLEEVKNSKKDWHGIPLDRKKFRRKFGDVRGVTWDPKTEKLTVIDNDGKEKPYEE